MAVTKVTDAMRNVTAVDATKISGAVPSASLTNVDLSKLEYNQAILAFKVASANQLAKFSMVDQVIDEYQDATGIDAGASTNENAGGATTSKYFHGGSSSTPTVTGGTITTYGDYTIHSFLTGANLITDTAISVEYLCVGGGGEGGDTYAGGGGGAGEFRTGTSFSLPAATYTISVGAGGTGRTDDGDKGDSSSIVGSGITDVISIGGGGGAGYNGGSGSSNSAQMQGGSGGGGHGSNGTQLGGATTGNGNAGGAGVVGSVRVSGGGGGAGAAGQDWQISTDPGTSGNGGAGLSSTIRDGTTAVFYAAGGGGGLNGSGGTPGVGGSSIGGNGGNYSSATSGTAAGANTGSGGGGGGNSASTNGGAGGSGIVIIKRTTTEITGGSNLTLQSVATTAESAPTTADLVMLIEDNGSGTATINTDIKAKVSRDGSAFSGYVTLVDEGDWGTDKRILVARNIDISGIASGVAMKYKIETFNQSAGVKETRIHATSLAWA